MAAVMGDFLAAHRAATDRRQVAVEGLTAAVIASANLLGPLVKASGKLRSLSSDSGMSSQPNNIVNVSSNANIDLDAKGMLCHVLELSFQSLRDLTLRLCNQVSRSLRPCSGALYPGRL